MILNTTPAMARLGARVRFGLLALVAMLVGHNAVYVAEHGLGDGLRSAMTTLGHDGYWGTFTLLAVMAGVILMAASAATLWRLQRRIDDLGPAEYHDGRDVSYRLELTAIFPRLLVTVLVLFAVQENVEAILTTGDVPGVDVLLAGGLPIAPVVLAVVSLALAALGALVRWRIAGLRARLADVAPSARTVPSDTGPAREWADVHAAAPHRWTVDRRDAGRAPPPLPA